MDLPLKTQDLMQLAKEYLEASKNFEKLERESADNYRKFSNQAAETLTHFKAGDFIEYTTTKGVFDKKKSTARMRVTRMFIKEDGIQVYGVQANAKGEVKSGNSAYKIFAFDEIAAVVVLK